MEIITLISWNKEWEVKFRLAKYCYIPVAFILILLIIFFVNTSFYVIAAIISIIVIFIVLQLAHWGISIYVKRNQNIHIFTKDTVTIITRKYKFFSILFKRKLNKSDHTSSHQDEQLKYLTTRTLDEKSPNFFGFSICGKLLTISWTYSEQNQFKQIKLENIQEEDWQRERETILSWINEARKDIGNLKQSKV
jgi:hypothetical protein